MALAANGQTDEALALYGDSSAQHSAMAASGDPLCNEQASLDAELADQHSISNRSGGPDRRAGKSRWSSSWWATHW
jgi:hypothetical protein